MQHNHLNYLLYSMLVFAILAFQNCGQIAQPIGSSSSFSSRSPSNNGGDPSNPGNPLPPPNSSGIISDWNGVFVAGVKVNNCMTDPNYNLCLPFVDPITANNNMAFNPRLTYATANNNTDNIVLSMGFKVPDNGTLENDNYRIISQSKFQPENGNWKRPLQDDTNNQLAQINVFVALNYQIDEMKRRTGRFYAEGRAIGVTAFTTANTARMNAYFNGGSNVIVFGCLEEGNDCIGAVGLDTPVAYHENGHANLYAASNGSGVSSSVCQDKNGCFGAIHEGVGDIHSFFINPDQTNLGKFFLNNTTGIRSLTEMKTNNLTSQDKFNIRNGEIHDMGEVYASIWYEVWIKSKDIGEQNKVEQLFTSHLATLSSNDNFSTALASIISLIDQSNFNNPNTIKQFFNDEYDRLQIDR